MLWVEDLRQCEEIKTCWVYVSVAMLLYIKSLFLNVFMSYSLFFPYKNSSSALKVLSSWLLSHCCGFLFGYYCVRKLKFWSPLYVHQAGCPKNTIKIA